MLAHIPDKGQVTQRYYGWYANRPRGMRRQQAEQTDATAPVLVVPVRPLPPIEARRRWVDLLRQIFEVDPRPWNSVTRGR